MSKKLLLTLIILVIGITPLWPNHTRMATLMAGDYIDDIIFTDLYPHRMLAYKNNLHLDIAPGPEDFGIFFTPNTKYGVIGLWQNPVTRYGFNLGYAITVFKFDLGISFSPVKDNIRFGVGLGRAFFDQRFDISFLTFDGTDEKWHKFTARYVRKLGDFSVTPRYSFDYIFEPSDYGKHRFGFFVQRNILNEGFVFLGAEYDLSRGDIEYDSTHIRTGVELKLSRILILRCGVAENFEGGFENATWQVEPGIGLRIRDFRLDLHLNKDWLFDKEQTFFKSFGLDFDFGRF